MWRNMSKLCSCAQCCSIVWFVMGNLWAKMMILHCYTLVEGATCCTRWREHCLRGFLWLVCGFVRHVVLEVPNDSTVSCTTLRKFRLSAETCFITIFRMMDLHWCIACTWKRNKWIPGVLLATAAAMWRNMSKLCSCVQCCSIVWFVMGNLWAKLMILHCYTLVEGATCCTRWREHCLSGFLWMVCGFVRHVVLEVPNDSTVSCTTLRKFRLSAETCFITIFRMMDLHWCIVNIRVYHKSMYMEEE